DAVDVADPQAGVGERGRGGLDHVVVDRQAGVAPDVRVAAADDGNASSGGGHQALVSVSATGRKNGSVSSGCSSTNVTSTGMPMRKSSSVQSVSWVMNISPGSSSSSTV